VVLPAGKTGEEEQAMRKESVKVETVDDAAASAGE
jgi:hypothetical protein